MYKILISFCACYRFIAAFKLASIKAGIKKIKQCDYQITDNLDASTIREVIKSYWDKNTRLTKTSAPPAKRNKPNPFNLLS